MHRFFLPKSNITSDQVTFSEAISRQMAQVLRLKEGASVVVLDGEGSEYQVKLTVLDPHCSEGQVESQGECLNEPKTRITLYLCLTQREKFEWVLQKCTEVGVCRFVPVISSRSLIQDTREIANKFERWKRILQEAAEQSHRGRIPELAEPLNFRAAVEKAGNTKTCCLIPWEEEQSLSLTQALAQNPAEHLSVLIGPEGGFSKEEVARAQEAGFLSVTLGKRILRMETAAVVACALALYERGDMGGRLDQTAGK